MLIYLLISHAYWVLPSSVQSFKSSMQEVSASSALWTVRTWEVSLPHACLSSSKVSLPLSMVVLTTIKVKCLVQSDQSCWNLIRWHFIWSAWQEFSNQLVAANSSPDKMSPDQISAALVTSESSSDVKVCFKALNFILGGFKLQKWVPGKILMLDPL